MRQRFSFVSLLALAGSLTACHIQTDPPVNGSGSNLTSDGGVACGATTCTEGTVCCNASCGICTAPGDFCTQQQCDVDAPGNSCAEVTCPEGQSCIETPSGAQCAPHEDNPCAATSCMTGNECVVENGQAKCVPISEEPPTTGECAVALCPPGTYCDGVSGKAQCIKAPSCSGVSCAKGQHCELQEVQCIRAPCPPQPQCVPDVTDPCATVRCAAGTHCEAKEVQCIRAPCPPIAECVPDSAGVKCGKNTCGAGQECCNASCGICVPKGNFCTQQFCQ